MVAYWKGKSRAVVLKERYGLTEAQWDEMFQTQGGKCAICLKPQHGRRLAVDHDHKSGKVRGLLCWRCNKYLISNHRDPELFYSAGRYLERAFTNASRSDMVRSDPSLSGGTS